MCLFVSSAALCLTACGTFPLTSYNGPDAEQRDRQLWTNMRDVQTAAEHYAANHDGDKYPTTIDDAFKSYMPGGGEDNEKARPVGLVNPFNGANEWPVVGSITDVMAVRNGPVPTVRPGEIQYSPLDGGKGYAIIGGGHEGRALRDYDGRTLVFTNWSEEELAEQAEGKQAKTNR